MGILHKSGWRQIEPTLVDRLTRSPVVVLTGARQVGKTTLVRNFVGAADRTYVTLDSLTTLDRARNAPETLLEGNAPITIDEVQRAPDLLIAIKAAVDRDRTPGRFLLTGSANLSMLSRVSESLAGRSISLTMRPLVECEKRGDSTERERAPWSGLLDATDTTTALKSLPTPRPIDWRTAAIHGGFPPAAYSATDIDRQLWFENYVQTYVERDLRDLAQIGDLSAFVRLAKLAFLRTGGLINHASLARDADLGRSTAIRWLSILETSYLLTSIPAFATSRAKRLIKAPKFFAGDTGLALHLAGIDTVSELAAQPASGAWLENLVLNDLLVWRENVVPRPALSHWRESNGAEVDFVVEQKRRLLPIEVKSARSVRVDDARHIEMFCEEYGTRAPFGIVLYDGAEAYPLTKHVIAVPLGAVV